MANVIQGLTNIEDSEIGSISSLYKLLSSFIDKKEKEDTSPYTIEDVPGSFGAWTTSQANKGVDAPLNYKPQVSTVISLNRIYGLDASVPEGMILLHNDLTDILEEIKKKINDTSFSNNSTGGSIDTPSPSGGLGSLLFKFLSIPNMGTVPQSVYDGALDYRINRDYESLSKRLKELEQTSINLEIQYQDYINNLSTNYNSYLYEMDKQYGDYITGIDTKYQQSLNKLIQNSNRRVNQNTDTLFQDLGVKYTEILYNLDTSYQTYLQQLMNQSIDINNTLDIKYQNYLQQLTDKSLDIEKDLDEKYNLKLDELIDTYKRKTTPNRISLKPLPIVPFNRTFEGVENINIEEEPLVEYPFPSLFSLPYETFDTNTIFGLKTKEELIQDRLLRNKLKTEDYIDVNTYVDFQTNKYITMPSNSLSKKLLIGGGILATGLTGLSLLPIIGSAGKQVVDILIPTAGALSAVASNEVDESQRDLSISYDISEYLPLKNLSDMGYPSSRSGSVGSVYNKNNLLYGDNTNMFSSNDVSSDETIKIFEGGAKKAIEEAFEEKVLLSKKEVQDIVETTVKTVVVEYRDIMGANTKNLTDFRQNVNYSPVIINYSGESFDTL